MASILLKRGLEANRGALSLYEGEIIYTRDTGRLYVGSGSSSNGQEIKFNQLTSSAALIQTSSAARLTLQSAASVANGNSIFGSLVSAGTIASPSATLAGHYTAWQMQTFGGSTWSTTARILMQTSIDHNENSRPTDIIFYTVTSGSTSLTQRLKINGGGISSSGYFYSNGDVQIVGNVTASNFLGTSSYSLFAVTSSYVSTSSYSLNSIYSSSFSTRVTGLENGSASMALASASFSSRVSGLENTSVNLVTASGSFSVRVTGLENGSASMALASASFSTRATNLENGSASMALASASFSTRLSSFTGSVYGTSSWATNAITATTANGVAYSNVSGIVATSTFGGTASYAVTSSYSLTANTANSVAYGNVTGIIATSTFGGTASYSTTASYSVTAGTANSVAYSNVTGINATSTFSGTASYALNSIYSSSFSTRVTSLENGSASMALASASFSTRLTSFTGSIYGTASWAANAVSATSAGTATNVAYSGVTGITATSTFAGTASYSSKAEATLNSATFNNGGSGDASGTTFNGSVVRTISYNTVGAPSITGTNAYGTWSITSSFASGLLSAGNYNVNQLTASAIQVTNLNVVMISASVEYSSGSNVFGSVSTNKHQFTGSVEITGSGFNVRANSTLTGSLDVSGSFTALAKSFLINHPTKDGMKLQYGVAEGPEHSVFVRGKLTGGIITLPEYWYNLVDNDTITVQLTPIGKFQKLYVQNVDCSYVYIANEDNNPIECYYFVQAERKDIPKLIVEF